MATLASYDGSDNAHLRYDNLVSSSVGVMVEEDMTYDSEMAHTTEVVSYLVVENGATLTALGSEVERVNYALAGQTIAVQVTTTPPMTTTDGLHYIHSDHLGSASAMSDANGAYVTDSLARYKPFGEYSLEPDTNPDVTDMGFTGHKHNDDLGLIYMNARFYVPGIGRFASADTIVPDPNNPQQFNRYSYVLNNPLKLTDPSGHCAEGYMGDDYEDTGCLELAQLASQLIGTTNVLYKDEIESLYNFDWQSEEEVYAFVEQYNDLLDTLEWVAPRLNFLDTLGPTPEQHDRALDKLNDFFDGTATEATGHVFFIHFAQEFDKMGIDPEWNLTLSKSAQNAGEFVGSFGESLTKITVQVAGIELPILIAASLREGSRGAVFLVLLFNEISYETALPPLNN
jgi:RHS repeat-associated protein